MIYKEKLASKLKEQILLFDEIKDFIKEHKKSINEIISTLNDESKLGASSAFDFGK